MTAASGDPGEAPPPDPAYGPPGAPVYGSYPSPPPPPPPQGYPPPPYGQPYQGGYPGYPGYPPGYPGYPPPRQTGTNALAIVALVSSVLGLLCGLGSLLGIALGLIAINQIKKTGQQGYALAVSAIVVGVAALLLSIIMWTYARNMS